jgi:hypothetical protein
MVVIGVVVGVVVAGRGRVHEQPARHFGHEAGVVVEGAPRGGGGVGLEGELGFGVGDVLELLVVVGGRGGRRGGLRHEVVVRERSPHGGRGRGGRGGLDLARGVVARGARGELVRVVREVELRDRVAQAHERRGVERVRGLGLGPEAAEPDALLLLRVANLRHPLPPAPHSHSAVLARARRVSPALRFPVRHSQLHTPTSRPTKTKKRTSTSDPVHPQIRQPQ